MSITLQDREFQECIRRIEALLHALEHIKDREAERHAREIMQAVMDLHSMGLERILELVSQAGDAGAAAGTAILDKLASDEVVGGLLLLHDLHPLSLEERVGLALEKVRPYLQSHGGNVELVGIHAGVVALRMQGSCHGCPSSAMTLKLAIEEAIYGKAPDVVALEVEGVVEEKAHGTRERQEGPSNFVPVEAVTHGGRRAGGGGEWQVLAHTDGLGEGAWRHEHVAGLEILLCRVGGRLYAYEANCAACHRKLEGRLEQGVMTCAGCGQRFDVRLAGRGVEDAALHLEPLPLLEEGGIVRIALPLLQNGTTG